MTLVVMEYDNIIPNSSATVGYSKANRADNRFLSGSNLEVIYGDDDDDDHDDGK